MKYILFTLILIRAISLFAHEPSKDSIVPEPKTIIRISLLAPGFQVEQTIARNKTVVFDLWSGFLYSYSRVNGKGSSSFLFSPAFTVQPRFYSDLEYRRFIHKITDNYSGAYLGVPLSLSLRDLVFSAGVVGGFQRKLGIAGFWSVDLGIGIRILNQKTGFTPMGSFSLGFKLN